MVRLKSKARAVAEALAFLAFVASAAFAPEARASDGRIVVIDVDARVADALVVALSPWSLTVVRTPGPSPAPPPDAPGARTIDMAAARARVIASDQHAGAVVWITPPQPPDLQASLWVYDAQTLELTIRPVNAWGTMDDAAAAAVALSVKTILRASPLVTEGPATASHPEAAQPGAPSTGEPPPGAPPEAARSAPAGEPPEPSRAPAAVAAPAGPAPSWRFEALVGGRGPTGASSAVVIEAGLGAAFWPASLRGAGGLGLEVQASPGVSVGTAAFQGELRVVSFEATARARIEATRWLAFEAQVGPSLLLTTLDGKALPSAAELHAVKLDPAIDAWALADFALGPRVGLGVAVGSSALLRFQRYSLNGATLLDEPAWIGLFGLRFSVGID
jgi:hypothetical protein